VVLHRRQDEAVGEYPEQADGRLDAVGGHRVRGPESRSRGGGRHSPASSELSPAAGCGAATRGTAGRVSVVVGRRASSRQPFSCSVRPSWLMMAPVSR
jgi:hypothetical protein